MHDILADRYSRNLGTLGTEGQEKLNSATVAIIGVGGLGGYVVEQLARVGIGNLILFDGDNFSASNLNRQILSTENNLNKNKAEEAAKRVTLINSNVKVSCHDIFFSTTFIEVLKNCNVVVDCLDNVQARLELATCTKSLSIPLVHAAIAGFSGQVTTISSDSNIMEKLYKNLENKNHGIETMVGNLMTTVALASSIQTQEVIKLITGIGEPLVGKLFYFDLEFMTFEIFDIG